MQEDFKPEDEITLTEFNTLCDDDTYEWSYGPMIEQTNACGYKDVMYMPNKKVFGLNKDGKFIWAWATGKNVRK